MKITNRSRLKIAAQIILIPSMLSAVMAWCSQDSIDTDHYAPVNAKAMGPVVAETTVASTQTTATTVTLTTATTTITEATAVVINLPEVQTVTTTQLKGRVLNPKPQTSTTTSTTSSTTTSTTLTDITTTATTTVKTQTIIVYKPSTHYVHTNKCRWYNSSCYEIHDTEDIEARKCTECNPDIEILHEYSPPTITTTEEISEIEIQTETSAVSDDVDDISDTSTDSEYPISAYDRQLLAEIVWHEAGSNWISQYDKAKIAAGVMNRVYDSRFPSTVYGVLTAPYQFSGYYPGCCSPSQACYDAVDYYFSHIGEFNNDNSWYGDGRQNHFYHI